MIEYNQLKQGEIPTDTELGVKVIGVGGAGANVLDRMALEGTEDAELLTLNTDVRALSTSVSSEKVQLGATLLKGMGTGGDPSLGKQAALEAVDEIRAAVRESGIVFICVGLGGGTGSGAAPEVCRIAREEGVFLVVFATMPFSFEGARRTLQAKESLETISRYANAVITFDNDRMGELIVPKDGVTQAFAAADKIISQSIRATMNVVFRPGIIRIGMDDLLSALDADDSRCLFGYGMAKGDNRSHEAVEQALKCPLLDRGKLLNDANAILVQVAGGDTMTLYEVQLVMEEVTKHVGSKTQILFGTGTDKRLGNSLSVTIISSISGPESNSEGPPEVDEVEEPAVSLGMPPTMPISPLAGIAESDDSSADENEAPTLSVEEDEPVVLGGGSEPTSLDDDDDTENFDGPVEDSEESAESDDEGSSIFEPLEDGGVDEESPAYSPEPIGAIDADDEPEDEDDRNPIARAIGGTRGLGSDDVTPIQPISPEAVDKDDTADVDRVEAVTDTEQKITLTRMVSSGNTGRIKARAPKDAGDGPALPPVTKAPAMPPETLDPEPSAEAKQQQEMLQLEPIAGKGRFAKTDPTIVDGEDLDVPTFLRKKK